MPGQIPGPFNPTLPIGQYQNSFQPSLNSDLVRGSDASFLDRSKAYTPHTTIDDNSFQHFTATFWRTKHPELMVAFFHAGMMGQETVNFVTNRILPFKETTTEEFRFQTWTFDLVLADLVPPGALPNQQISHTEQYSVRLDRWGQQFEMFDEELDTPDGNNHFVHNVIQMGVNRLTTMKLTGLHALSAPEVIDRSDEYQFGKMDPSNLDDALIKRAESFAPLSKEKMHTSQSLFSLITIGLSAISQVSGLKADTLILPPGSDIILQQSTPTQTYFFEYEGTNPNPKVLMGMNTPLVLPGDIATFIAELPRLSNRQDSADNLDVLKRSTILGEYYLMHSLDNPVCNDKCWEADVKDIELYDVKRNAWIRVYFKDAIEKSNIFKKGEDGWEWSDAMSGYTGGHTMFHQGVFSKLGIQEKLVQYVLQISDISGPNGVKRTAAHLLSKFLSENPSITRSYDSYISEAKALIRKIAEQVPTADYFTKFIGIKIGENVRSRVRAVKRPVTKHDTNGAPFIQPGADFDILGMDYPAGFTNYSCLKTLSEYNGTSTKLKDIRVIIKPFIEIIENLVSFLQIHLPESELISQENIQPWLDTDLAGNVLIESLIGRFEPVLVEFPSPKAPPQSYAFEGRRMDSKVTDKALEKFMEDRIKENNSYPVYKAIRVLNDYGIDEFMDKYENALDKKSKDLLLDRLYQSALQLEDEPKNITDSGEEGKYYVMPIDATPGIVEFITEDNFKNSKTTFRLAVGALNALGSSTANLNDRSVLIQLDKNMKIIRSSVDAIERHSNLSFLSKNLETTEQPETKLSIGRPFSFKDDLPVKKIGVSITDSHKSLLKNHFGMTGMDNVKMIDSMGSVLLMIILHSFLTCKNIPKTFMTLVELGVYIPLNVLLTRPQIRLETSAAILCASNIGNTYYIRGQQYNAPSETGKRRYTVYLKWGCVIHNPKAIFYLPNAKLSGYLAGLSTDWFDMEDDTYTSPLEEQIHRTECFSKSLIGLVVPATYRPDSEILYLTDQNSKLKKETMIPNLEFYDKAVWKFSLMAYNLAEQRRMTKGVYYSLFRGPHYRYNPLTNSFTEDSFVSGTGHLAKLQYVGCGPVLRGTQLAVDGAKRK